MPQYKYLYKYKYGSHPSSTPTLHLIEQGLSAYDFAKTVFCSNRGSLPIKSTLYGATFKVTNRPTVDPYGMNYFSLSGTIYYVDSSGHEEPYSYYILKKDHGSVVAANYSNKAGTIDLYRSERFPDYESYLAHLKTVDDRYNNHQDIAWSDAMITIIIWIGRFFEGAFRC
jgi:hypothetical protein